MFKRGDKVELLDWRVLYEPYYLRLEQRDSTVPPGAIGVVLSEEDEPQTHFTSYRVNFNNDIVIVSENFLRMFP
jgi:hypothetical protein